MSILKRALALLLVLCMSLSGAITAFAAPLAGESRFQTYEAPLNTNYFKSMTADEKKAAFDPVPTSVNFNPNNITYFINRCDMDAVVLKLGDVLENGASYVTSDGEWNSTDQTLTMSLENGKSKYLFTLQNEAGEQKEFAVTLNINVYSVTVNDCAATVSATGGGTTSIEVDANKIAFIGSGMTICTVTLKPDEEKTINAVTVYDQTTKTNLNDATFANNVISFTAEKAHRYVVKPTFAEPEEIEFTVNVQPTFGYAIFTGPDGVPHRVEEDEIFTIKVKEVFEKWSVELHTPFDDDATSMINMVKAKKGNMKIPEYEFKVKGKVAEFEMGNTFKPTNGETITFGPTFRDISSEAEITECRLMENAGTETSGFQLIGELNSATNTITITVPEGMTADQVAKGDLRIRYSDYAYAEINGYSDEGKEVADDLWSWGRKNPIALGSSMPCTITAEDGTKKVYTIKVEAEAKKVTYQEALNNALDYLEKNVSAPEFGSVGGEWSVLALNRGGRVDSTYNDAYYARIEEYVKSIGSGKLHDRKATDNFRLILALSSIGKDARDVAGFDLVAPIADFDWDVWQGNNAGSTALLAINSAKYRIPEDAAVTTQATEEKLIDDLVSKALPDGGWNINSGGINTDTTFMVIQALAPYYNEREDVKTAVDAALAKLALLQDATTGAMTYGGGATSESCAQAIVGLTAMGIDPATWNTGDGRPSLIDALLEYYVPETGGFKHVLTGVTNGMATDQATYALVAYDRFLKEDNALYDMTDVFVAEYPEDSKYLESTPTLVEESGATLTFDETAKTVKINTANKYAPNLDKLQISLPLAEGASYVSGNGTWNAATKVLTVDMLDGTAKQFVLKNEQGTEVTYTIPKLTVTGYGVIVEGCEADIKVSSSNPTNAVDGCVCLTKSGTVTVTFKPADADSILESVSIKDTYTGQNATVSNPSVNKEAKTVTWDSNGIMGGHKIVVTPTFKEAVKNDKYLDGEPTVTDPKDMTVTFTDNETTHQIEIGLPTDVLYVEGLAEMKLHLPLAEGASYVSGGTSWDEATKTLTLDMVDGQAKSIVLKNEKGEERTYFVPKLSLGRAGVYVVGCNATVNYGRSDEITVKPNELAVVMAAMANTKIKIKFNPEDGASLEKAVIFDTYTKTEISCTVVDAEAGIIEFAPFSGKGHKLTVTPTFKASEKPSVEYEDALKGVLDYLEKNVPDPVFGSVGGEWAVLALNRGGRMNGPDDPYNSAYYDRIVNEVNKLISAEGRLHAAKSTENSRLIVALSSIGIDARDVGGHDLTTAYSDMAWVKKQGINGPIWTLIALNSAGYHFTEEGDATEQKLIDFVLSKQLDNGGWALSGMAADPDMTGMAIQSLAPYYGKMSAVTDAVDRAINALAGLQKENGGFASWGSINSESCAQVIVALTSVGIDPATWNTEDGRPSVLEAMLEFYDPEKGSFNHTLSGEGVNLMATEQGAYALVAYDRFVKNKNTLYDMTDVYKADYDETETGTLAEILEALKNDEITAEEAVQKLKELDPSEIENAQDVYEELYDVYQDKKQVEGHVFDTDDMGLKESGAGFNGDSFILQVKKVNVNTKPLPEQYKKNYQVIPLEVIMIVNSAETDSVELPVVVSVAMPEGFEGKNVTALLYHGNDDVETIDVTAEGSYISWLMNKFGYVYLLAPSDDAQYNVTTDQDGLTFTYEPNADGSVTVTVKVTPPVDQQLKEGSLTYTKDGATTVINPDADGAYSFVIDPEDEVTVTCEWETQGEEHKISAGGPSGGSLSFKVDGQTVVNGKVRAGRIVTVIATPAPGKKMVEGSLKYGAAVAGADMVEIPLVDGKYQFTMPNSDVNVSCQWEDDSAAAEGASIVEFTIDGVKGVIDQDKNTITVTLPRRTDVTKLAPRIITENAVSVTPNSDEVQDFTSSVRYTVKAEDGSSRVYTVTVKLEGSSLSDDLWDAMEDFADMVPWWEYADHQYSYGHYPKYW